MANGRWGTVDRIAPSSFTVDSQPNPKPLLSFVDGIGVVSPLCLMFTVASALLLRLGCPIKDYYSDFITWTF
jgi:hypothetical protein